MSNVVKIIVEEKDLVKELGSLIESIAHSSVASSGIFNVGVSGGSLVQTLEKCLPTLNTDWSKWRIYFCDERVVPFDSPDSTYGLYKKSLSGIIPIRDDQYVAIAPGLSAADAAVDYEKRIRENFSGTETPQFDLLLLGVGPDGHTCSLFPGHPLLKEDKLLVAPITDSPKPPPSRITLTFPVIHNAKNCIFALSGKGKASIIKRILDDQDDLPATMVNSSSGAVYWIIDKEAASELKIQP